MAGDHNMEARSSSIRMSRLNADWADHFVSGRELHKDKLGLLTRLASADGIRLIDTVPWRTQRFLTANPRPPAPLPLPAIDTPHETAADLQSKLRFVSGNLEAARAGLLQANAQRDNLRTALKEAIADLRLAHIALKEADDELDDTQFAMSQAKSELDSTLALLKEVEAELAKAELAKIQAEMRQVRERVWWDVLAKGPLAYLVLAMLVWYLFRMIKE